MTLEIKNEYEISKPYCDAQHNLIKAVAVTLIDNFDKQWVSLDSLKEFLEDELISEQEEVTTKWSSEEERHTAAKKYEAYESLLIKLKEYEKEE